MFVIKSFAKTLPQFSRILIKNNNLASSRSVFTQFLLSTKYSSPESSPIKNVTKKKRKISSSSEEEDAPVAKKVSSVDLKKSPKTPKETKPKKSPAATKKTPKVKTPEVKPSTSSAITPKTESPENKPQNGQSSPEKVQESPKVQMMNVLKIQSADSKGADYNPSKKNYHPINDAFWKKGEK